MQGLVLKDNAVRWVTCKLLGSAWPAVYWSGLANLRLVDHAQPPLPGSQWVRVRTRLGGICGTDLGLVLQRTHPASIVRPFCSFPMALGHENVAEIDAIGSGVTGWVVGQRVVVEPALSCEARGILPRCRQCEAGLFSLCEHFDSLEPVPAGAMIGLNRATGGSWSPFFVAHESQLHAVPDALSDEDALLVDPLACSLHAVLRHVPSADDVVLVQGAGIIGLGVVQGLRAVGCASRIIAVARHREQEVWLLRFGADEVLRLGRGLSRRERFDRVATVLGGRRVASAFGNQTLVGGADVVYECVGSGQGLSDGMKYCRPRGTVVAVGTSQIAMIDSTALWFNELNLKGAYGRQMEADAGSLCHTYDRVLAYLQEGRMRATGLLTHTFEVADYRSAFATLYDRRRSGAIKVAFRFSS